MGKWENNKVAAECNERRKKKKKGEEQIERLHIQKKISTFRERKNEHQLMHLKAFELR